MHAVSASNDYVAKLRESTDFYYFKLLFGLIHAKVKIQAYNLKNCTLKCKILTTILIRDSFKHSVHRRRNDIMVTTLMSREVQINNNKSI